MSLILPHQTPLYALTDSRLSLGRPVEEVAAALLKAGVKILQYREKKAKAGQMLKECTVLRRLTREAGACFIINDHIDIAMLVDADGVHVGQEDLPVPAVRQLLGPQKIIGLSTHNPEQARAALEAGADYIGVGPIFATQTKEDVCAPVGYDYLDWVAAHSDLPFVAIGGIKIHNIAEVVSHGARCCALVSELVGAPDIAMQVAKVRQEIAKGKALLQEPA
ncbi:MAG: thiamine phosphate synthase [Desulfovibrionaceae bacterium]